MNADKPHQNLPAPPVFEGNWFLLADVPGYYGREKSPCSMGIYLGIEPQRRFIHHIFLNGKEAYYGHSLTDDPAGRDADVVAALSRAWSNYRVSPDKWRIAENDGADIQSPEHRQTYLQYLNQLRDLVAKHKSSEPVIPRPLVFHKPDQARFNAYDVDIIAIP